MVPPRCTKIYILAMNEDESIYMIDSLPRNQRIDVKRVSIMESLVRVVHSDQISYEMPQPELPLGQREDPRHSMMGCWGLCHHWPLRFQVVLTAASLSMGYRRLWTQVLVRVR